MNQMTRRRRDGHWGRKQVAIVLHPTLGSPQVEGALPMRQFIVIGTVLLAAACGSPQSTPGAQAPAANTAAEPSAVQLGGPAPGAGTSPADPGEIKPADPTTFNKEPGYSPY